MNCKKIETPAWKYTYKNITIVREYRNDAETDFRRAVNELTKYTAFDLIDMAIESINEGWGKTVGPTPYLSHTTIDSYEWEILNAQPTKDKIQAIKQLREKTGMGLKDAKEIIEALQCVASIKGTSNEGWHPE